MTIIHRAIVRDAMDEETGQGTGRGYLLTFPLKEKKVFLFLSEDLWDVGKAGSGGHRAGAGGDDRRGTVGDGRPVLAQSADQGVPERRPDRRLQGARAYANTPLLLLLPLPPSPPPPRPSPFTAP